MGSLSVVSGAAAWSGFSDCFVGAAAGCAAEEEGSAGDCGTPGMKRDVDQTEINNNKIGLAWCSSVAVG